MAMSMSSSSPPSPPLPPPAAASDVTGTDILLSLLPEILDDILTRLPLKEVSASGLDVRFRGFYSAGAVAGVLARCAAPVASFDIEVRPRLRPRAAYWLRALAEKRVRSLQLAFGSSRADEPGVFPGVGRAIYARAELSNLYLRYCELPRPPPPQPGQGSLFAGFPRLTRLALNSVKLPFAGAGALLERVIAGAPDLADLLLVDVITGVVAGGEKKVEEEEPEAWAIRAPKLHSLTLWTPAVDNGCRVAGELPLLNAANISVDAFLGTEDFLDTLWLVSRVKVLKFSVRDRENRKEYDLVVVFGLCILEMMRRIFVKIC
uniref:F-box/LRR-repeat protein 15/At3g58940/PEG3-like LRR domain-containing protein n=1 Tax=Oryza nivara TaxID=4536 RepID=A0A0E0I9G1_ORYNI